VEHGDCIRHLFASDNVRGGGCGILFADDGGLGASSLSSYFKTVDNNYGHEVGVVVPVVFEKFAVV